PPDFALALSHACPPPMKHSASNLNSFSLFPMLPRPPSPTLFPYTTLFRSFLYYHRPLWDVVVIALSAGGIVSTVTAAAPALTVEDRKSTRLNSSHVSISYAVFCLKKKIGELDARDAPRIVRGEYCLAGVEA